jgi:hypothetical protein
MRFQSWIPALALFCLCCKPSPPTASSGALPPPRARAQARARSSAATQMRTLLQKRLGATRHYAGSDPVIYVRSTGNDSNNCTAVSSACRTLQHALNIRTTAAAFKSAAHVIVDVTGINDTSSTITPPYLDSQPIEFVSDSLSPAFFERGFVTIRAAPTVIDTLNAPTTSFSTDPVSGLLTVADSSKAYTPNALKGKYAVGSGFFEFGEIDANTPTTVQVASAFATFTAPITIVDVGATYTGPSGSLAALVVSSVKAKLVIEGVRFAHQDAYGNGVLAQNADELDFTLSEIKDAALVVNTLNMYGSRLLGEGGVNVIDTQLGASSLTFILSCWQDLTPQVSGTLTFEEGVLDNDHVFDQIGVRALFAFVQAHQQGLVFQSGAVGLFNVRVDSAVAAAHINPNGSGIVGLGPAQINLQEGAIGGSGNAGYGIELRSGAQAFIESTEPATLSITGALGDLKVGARPPQTNSNFNATMNEMDPLGSFARVGISDDTATPVAGLMAGALADRPTCAAALRGMQYEALAAAGTADTLYVCIKNSSDAYAWQQIF